MFRKTHARIVAVACLLGVSSPCFAFPPRSSHTLSYYHNAAPPGESFKNLDHKSLMDRLSDITHSLVGDDEIAFLGFHPTFRVIDSPFPNAYARGKSEIVLTTALVESIATRGEAAFVIAHELGHLTLGHTASLPKGERVSLVGSTLAENLSLREYDADCFAHKLLASSRAATSSDGIQLLQRIITSQNLSLSSIKVQFPTLVSRLDHLHSLLHNSTRSCS